MVDSAMVRGGLGLCSEGCCSLRRGDSPSTAVCCCQGWGSWRWLPVSAEIDLEGTPLTQAVPINWAKKWVLEGPACTVSDLATQESGCVSASVCAHQRGGWRSLNIGMLCFAILKWLVTKIYNYYWYKIINAWIIFFFMALSLRSV